MRTIFHANRKSVDGPRYCRVYMDEQDREGTWKPDGIYRYTHHRSRQERDDWEHDNRQWHWRQHTLYRVNVYPKPQAEMVTP
jgi:hypothetical protein